MGLWPSAPARVAAHRRIGKPQRWAWCLGLALAFQTLPGWAAGDATVALRRAIDYLDARQVRQAQDALVGGKRVVDFPGNWPQTIGLQGQQAFRVHEVSPFMVAFIHHALTTIVEEHRAELGLSDHDLRQARAMRQRAIGFMRRFESPIGTADAQTYAYWPYDTAPEQPRPSLALALTAWLKGPVLGGQRVPLNLTIYPDALAIPSDADVTATTYAALLDDARFDGGAGSMVAFERFFIDWRDLGQVPRRLNPPWLPPASGAFLTWLSYREATLPRFPNDVDLVVNANVLYALGRHGRLDIPGVAQAVALLNDTVARGLHRDRLAELTDYYPDNGAFQYMVSRAFHGGQVAALAPAVSILADDLEATALLRDDGTAFWDRGAPQLNTAFAVLTLLNAGRDAPVLPRAIAYLVAQQAASGGYDEAVFFIARNGGGQVFEFRSASFTTALVMEALARYRLAGGTTQAR
jgi:hypothetical protein